MSKLPRRALLKLLAAAGTATLISGHAQRAFADSSAQSVTQPARFPYQNLDYQLQQYVVKGHYADGSMGEWAFRYLEASVVELPVHVAQELGVEPISLSFRKFDQASRYAMSPLRSNEYLYIVAGSLRIKVGAQEFVGSQGDLFWAPEGTVLSYQAIGQAEVFVAQTPPIDLPRGNRGMGVLRQPKASEPILPPVFTRFADRQYFHVPAQLRSFADGSSRVQQCNFKASAPVSIETTLSESAPAAGWGHFPADALHGWMEIPYNEFFVIKEGQFRLSLTEEKYSDKPSQIRTLDCFPGDVLWLPKGTYLNYENVDGPVDFFAMLNPGCCFDFAVPGEWEPDLPGIKKSS